MKGMSELVEDRLHLVYVKIFLQVAHIHYYGANHVAIRIHILLADVVHPCPTPLAVTRQIVGGEDGEQGTVGIRHLVGGDYILVVCRHVIQFLHVDAIQSVCCNEDTLHHILQLEIRLHHVLVQVVLVLPDLLGIVPPVPWLYLRAGRKLALCYVLVHLSLHVGYLQACSLHSLLHDAGEEGIHRLGILRHLVLKKVLGRIGVTHYLRLLYTQAHHVKQELPVVVVIAVVSAHGICLIHLLAPCPVLGGGHGIGEV